MAFGLQLWLWLLLVGWIMVVFVVVSCGGWLGSGWLLWVFLLCYFNSCLNYFNELYAKIEPLMLVVL